MHLLEETAFNAKNIVYKTETSPDGIPPPPPPPPDFLKNAYFKQRDYASLAGDLDHKIELKKALLSRVKDLDLIKQYKEEIKRLKKEIEKRKSK